MKEAPVDAGRWFALIEGFGWREALDIALVAVIATYLLRVVRNTRAFQMLRGLAVVAAATVFARYLSLHTTTWMLNSLMLVWVIALVIVLQPELRKLMISLGRQPLWRLLMAAPRNAPVPEIVEAARVMVQRGWGGLIVLERETSLAGFAETGSRISADVRGPLLATIFTPGSPLHDGAVLVRRGQIYAAGCSLPLSETAPGGRAYGMRHRAAMGMTEETDALVVVVSEEHKQVALAKDGQLTPPLDFETLDRMLRLHGDGRKEG